MSIREKVLAIIPDIRPNEISRAFDAIVESANFVYSSDDFIDLLITQIEANRRLLV